MPTLEAFIGARHADGQKQQLIVALTDAVVDAIGAPVDSVRIILSEVAAYNYGSGGQAPVTGADGIALIQVFLIAGRSDAQKQALIAALTAAAGTLAIPASAVQIIIKDVPNTDFGLAGQTAAALGRGIGRAEMAR